MVFSAFGSQAPGKLDLSALSPTPDWTDLQAPSSSSSQTAKSRQALSSPTANSFRAETSGRSQNVQSPEAPWSPRTWRSLQGVQEDLATGGILGSAKNSARLSQGSNASALDNSSGPQRPNVQTNKSSSVPALLVPGSGIFKSPKNSAPSHWSSAELSGKSRLLSQEAQQAPADSRGSIPVIAAQGICNSLKNSILSHQGSEDLSGRSGIQDLSDRSGAQRTPSHKSLDDTSHKSNTFGMQSPKMSMANSHKGVLQTPKNSTRGGTPVSGRSTQLRIPKGADVAKVGFQRERVATWSAGGVPAPSSLPESVMGFPPALASSPSPASSRSKIRPGYGMSTRGNQTSKQPSADTKPGTPTNDTCYGLSPEELDGALREPLFESSPPDPDVAWEVALEEMRKEIVRFQRRGKAELIALKAELFDAMVQQEEVQNKLMHWLPNS